MRIETIAVQLEGGIGALAVASGMAAIAYAIQTIAETGDNIVASSALYGGTYNLFAHTFAQQGIEVRTWCACRSVSSISTTCWPIWSRRWRPFDRRWLSVAGRQQFSLTLGEGYLIHLKAGSGRTRGEETIAPRQVCLG